MSLFPVCSSFIKRKEKKTLIYYYFLFLRFAIILQDLGDESVTTPELLYSIMTHSFYLFLKVTILPSISNVRHSSQLFIVNIEFILQKWERAVTLVMGGGLSRGDENVKQLLSTFTFKTFLVPMVSSTTHHVIWIKFYPCSFLLVVRREKRKSFRDIS